MVYLSVILLTAATLAQAAPPRTGGAGGGDCDRPSLSSTVYRISDLPPETISRGARPSQMPSRTGYQASNLAPESIRPSAQDRLRWRSETRQPLPAASSRAAQRSGSLEIDLNDRTTLPFINNQRPRIEGSADTPRPGYTRTRPTTPRTRQTPQLSTRARPRLRRPGERNPRPMSEANTALLKQLEREARLQEAAWLLRQHGQESLALVYEGQLEQLMRSVQGQTPIEIVDFQAVEGSASRTLRLTYRGPQGRPFHIIFKAAAQHQEGSSAYFANHHAEIATYRFDRYFDGRTTVVTTEFTYQGQTGMAQAFIPNLESADAAIPPAHIRLLDYLIGNPDRHGGNWRTSFHVAGMPFGIDGGLSFFRHPSHRNRPFHGDTILVREKLTAWITQVEKLVNELGVPSERVAEISRYLGNLYYQLGHLPPEKWAAQVDGIHSRVPELREYALPVDLHQLFTSAAREATIEQTRYMVPDLETYERLVQMTRNPDTLAQQMEGLLNDDQIDDVFRRANILLQRVRALRPPPGWLPTLENRR